MRFPAYFAHPLSTVAPRDLLLLQHLGARQDDSVLEIGVGSGSSILRLADSVSTMHGVDLSPGAIDRLRRHLPDGLASRVELFELDFCRPGASDRLPVRYDIVFSCDTLEHVTDPAQFLANVYSALKPGGRAFITFPNESPGRAHGITAFDDPHALENILRQSGFDLENIDITSCDLTPFAAFVLRNAWLRPRRLLKRRIYRGAARNESLPQTFDETDFHKNAARLEMFAPVINAFCWSVMCVMCRTQNVFQLSPEVAPFHDRQILIRASRSRAEAPSRSNQQLAEISI